METRKTLLAAVVGLAFIGVLLAVAWRSQRTLILGLPPRIVVADQATGQRLASEWTRAQGGMWHPVLGTGSMAPYIPPGDPKAVVAYAVTKRDGTFASVTPGALCIYRWGALSVLHQAAAQAGAGWTMSGLHNARHDIVMTAENFTGIVDRVYVWNP